MDALDRLSGVGESLFERVGAVIGRGGVPDGSAAAVLLRRVGALPSGVLEYALRLDVDGLRGAAGEVRGVVERFAVLPGRLEADVGRSAWEGRGAEAFGVAWGALAAHMGEAGEPATIVGRLAATAAYLDGLAGWAGGFRHELAESIARVVSSAEAVVVVTGGGGGGEVETVGAAVRIVERVLRTAADALDAADALRGRWEGVLGEVEYQPPVVPRGDAVISGVTRVEL
jgi:hypothetical protein